MIQNYLSYLSNLKGMSPNTVVAYQKDLSNFASWAKHNIKDCRWSMITRDDIDRYVNAMVEKGLSAATTNRRLSAISGLYNYFHRQGMLVDNPCKYESRRKIGSRCPNTISISDLRVAYQKSRGAVKTMLGILITTGIRIGELLSITWEDIDFLSSRISILGKGSKGRVVYTTEEVLSSLRNYKDAHTVGGTIFRYTQRECRYMIYLALRPYCCARQLSPHAIRHTFATNIASAGGNVTQLAQILGHTNISTTQYYIDMSNIATRDITLSNNILN